MTPMWVRRLASVPLLLAMVMLPGASHGPSWGGRQSEIPRVGSPVAFEENRGQTDRSVRFLARAPGYTLFLTPHAAVFSIGGGAAVEMTLNGVVGPFDPVGVRPLDGKVNYLLGDDPAAWDVGIPTFGGVRYRDVYPGIDLRFRSGGGGGLEYDFVLAPGADPLLIGLAFRGARPVLGAPSGTLALETTSGGLLHGVPVAHQPGPAGWRPVPVSYRLQDGLVGFDVGDVDPSLPLVIDPPVTLQHSTFLGGAGGDSGWPVTVGGDGAVYVAGTTADVLPPFPTTPGALDESHNGSSDVFVTQLTPGLDALVYSTYLGGSASDEARGIGVDATGAAYIAGITGDPGVGTPFPTTPGAYDSSYNGGSGDAFVAKLNPLGSGLVYSTVLGGSGSDHATGLAVDPSGAVYLGGQTFDAATDYPTTPGAYDTSPDGGDGFASKLGPTGSDLVYSSFVGGTGFDLANDIDIDSSGAAYVTGQAGDGFPTTPSAFDPSFNGDNDAFATKLNPAGSELVYSTYLGGSGGDYGDGIAVDLRGVAHVTGGTDDASTDFPTTPGAFDTSHNGLGDAFLTAVAPSGASLSFSTFLGGGGYDTGYAVAVDGASGVRVVGGTSGGDPVFPTTTDAFDASPNGSDDAFVAMFGPTGALAYSTLLGGADDDEAAGVAVDLGGGTYVTGNTYDAPVPFPTTPGAFDTSQNGGEDAFVAHLSTAYSCRGRAVTRLGSTANDTIDGTSGPDVVLALDGRDVVKTRGGPDLGCAGNGNDTVNGGAGKDRLLGELGRDRLKGGGGRDRLQGGQGKDNCSGGGGKDKGVACEKRRGIP